MRQEVVHNAENAFLHFAAIFAARDYKQLSLEADYYRGFGIDTFRFRIEFESGCAYKRELGLVSFEFLFRGTQKHIVHKQVLRCVFVYYAHVQTELRVRTGITVEYEYIAVVEIALYFAENGFELSHGNFLVFRAPIYLVVYGSFVHDKTVFGTSARILARFHEQCARIRKTAVLCL